MKEGTKKVYKDTTKKVLEWSKEKNSHFCIHDLMDFYNNIPMPNLSSSVSKLRKEGKLIEAFSKESCKMSTKKHAFWIYNNKYKETESQKPQQPQPAQPKREFTRHRWNSNEEEEMRSLIAQKKTVNEIAKHFGVSYESVRRALKRRGLEAISDRGREPYHKWTEEDRKNMEALLKQGKPTRETAKEMGVSYSAVQRAKERYGLISKREKKPKKAVRKTKRKINYPKNRKSRKRKGEPKTRRLKICPLCGHETNMLIVQE
jgi:transposase